MRHKSALLTIKNQISHRSLRHRHVGKTAEIGQVVELAQTGGLLAVAAGIDGQRVAGGGQLRQGQDGDQCAACVMFPDRKRLAVQKAGRKCHGAQCRPACGLGKASHNRAGRAGAGDGRRLTERAFGQAAAAVEQGVGAGRLEQAAGHLLG